MAARASTVQARRDIATKVQALLVADPQIAIDDVAGLVFCAKRSINRALKAELNSNFRTLARAHRMDTAAGDLVRFAHRQRTDALRETARRAGYRSRHLIAPFHAHFSVTPAEAWRAARIASDLQHLAALPPPPARTRRYYNRRRRWTQLQAQLAYWLETITPGTVLHDELQAGSLQCQADFRRRRSVNPTAARRRRARRRNRGRRQ